MQPESMRHSLGCNSDKPETDLTSNLRPSAVNPRARRTLTSDKSRQESKICESYLAIGGCTFTIKDSSVKSPAPSSATPPATATHSRHPSALTGQGVSIKDGVSVPRSSASAVKQGSSVTFGSIDNASSTPISSSPASIPAINAETVKSFGTVPASPSTTQANGKSPVGSVRTAANGSSGATHASKPISKANISKLF
ncbi:hypothetical protein GLOTRDRAFT_123757 [Gloeophyllum trabeum ATCC 11539]|uniref:Uncharacterized protein n=1 Tax=Gloeophyllum trabeum (strain ATCC 11539 / FP-39264 / Madison 617) TaxID=670483 RepID=S7S2L8_GLOTA|nr:uncharacterized protein GLOTRDRAFT_123757 [Gloeophyllum trabeum ATCC 11539]EPQ59999.1 hypothetical protein GLOTRDRAFT_123757 [Gloeophyllum trabeum ATCC 11539]